MPKTKRAKPAAKKTGKKKAAEKKPAKKTTKKKASKAKSKKLVQITSPIRPENQFYVASELADDQQIEAGLLGETLPHFIYEFCPKKCQQFKDKGKCEHDTTKGLSVNGTNEVVRRLNRNNASGSKIRIAPEPPQIDEMEMNGQRGIRVMVYGEDLVSGNGIWGAKFEPYIQYGKPNTFAFEKALSKAQRNAKRALIPEKAAIALINKLIKEKGAVKQLDAPDQTVRDIVVEPTPSEVTYGATLRRVQQIKSDKTKLKEALTKVDGLKTLTDSQRSFVKTQIEEHLKSL